MSGDVALGKQRGRFGSTVTSSSSKRVATLATTLAALVFGLTPPSPTCAASLTVADEVVVKFDEAGGLRVRDRLTTGGQVLLTSLRDDAAIGPTLPQAQTPDSGDWRGVRIDPAVATTRLSIDRLRLRYAGAEGQAALELSLRDYEIRFVEITDSDIAIRVTDAGAPQFQGLTLTGNRIGLEADRLAQPEISQSDLADNSEYGVLNRTPTQSLVSAVGNWWGHPTGPAPGGSGSTASDGVDIGSPRPARPLIDCRVEPANGQYVVVRRDLMLRLHCRNAAWVRFRQQEPFPANYQAFPPALQLYQLTADPGTSIAVQAQFADSQPTAGTEITVETTQPIVFQPGLPTVAWNTPADGSIIGPGTQWLQLSASADDAEGVTRVEFRRGGPNGPLIAVDETAPYEAAWNLEALADGDYILSARAFNPQNAHTTAQLVVRLRRQPPDTQGPTIGTVRVGTTVLQPSPATTTLTSGGMLSFPVQDPSGMGSVSVSLAGTAVPGGLVGGSFNAPLLFEQLGNGAYLLVIQAHDSIGNLTELQFPLQLDRPALTAPVITSPTSPVTIALPQVTVAGTAVPGSTLTLYVDGAASGSQAVPASGAFSRVVSLAPSAAQATFEIHATANLSQQASPQSNTLQVQFDAQAPVLTINSPNANAVFDDVMPVGVSASDPLGVVLVQGRLNGASEPVFELTAPPYETILPVAGLPEGQHEINVVAVNTFGLSAQVGRPFSIERPVAPPPVVTPYQGRIDTISPSLTHGVTPVVITGWASNLVEGQLVNIPNSLLVLAMQRDGFERRINVTTDQEGKFSFQFRPQATDGGKYLVGARHPDEPHSALPDPGPQFFVDRLQVRDASMILRAAYGIPVAIPVHVTASPAVPVSNLRVYVHPNDVVPGVDVTPFNLEHLAGGASATLEPVFVAQSNAPSGQTIVLSVVQNPGPGEIVRARIPVQFLLSAPAPALWLSPTSLRSGVVHGEQAVEPIRVENRGPISATNLVAHLVKVGESHGQPVWSWLRMVSPAAQGDLGPGEHRTFEVTATPGATVPPGTYAFAIRLAADNSPVHEYPGTIRVVEEGEGAVRFHVQDIFTDPDGQFGIPTFGVEGARVRVQNEEVSTITATDVTDVNGMVTLIDLEPGRYTYRVSAPNRETAHGRIWVRPGTNHVDFALQEAVFLDYAAVSFEWSVTETTIPDRYDVTISAVFQTVVPAPMIVIRPASVNLPDMQVGEELTGVLTITNHGLISAENVVFTPPPADTYFSFEFEAEVPTTLPAGQSITLPYKLTSIAPLPELDQPYQSQSRVFSLAKLLQAPLATAGGACHAYSAGPQLQFDFLCANGDRRGGTAGSRFSKMYGTSCGTTAPRPVGQSGGGGGFYWGGYGAPTGVYPMGPPCVPGCTSCSCQPAGAGGGGGGGPGSGPGGNGGTNNPPPPPVGG